VRIQIENKSLLVIIAPVDFLTGIARGETLRQLLLYSRAARGGDRKALIQLPVVTYLFTIGEIVHDRDIVCIHKFIGKVAPYDASSFCHNYFHLTTFS
jgi:hypothetical protein